MKTRKLLLPFYALTLIGVFYSCNKEIPLADSNPGELDAQMKEVLSRYFLDYEIVNLDAAVLFQSVKNSKEGDGVSVQLEKGKGKNWQLDFYRNNVVEERLPNSPGIDETNEMERVLTFEGNQAAMVDESARLTLSSEFASGFVTEGGEQFYFEPVMFYFEDAEPDQYVVYSASSVIAPESECAVTSAMAQRTFTKDLEVDGTNLPALCRKVEVRASCDYPFFQNSGYSTSIARQRMAATINNADALYAPMGVDLVTTTTSFHVRTTPDSYSSDAPTMLNQFTAQGNANPTLVRDVWILFTKRNITYQGNSGVVGLAWTGVVCRNRNYSYAIIETTYASILTAVTAHELGHNLGAQHVGTCPGGIMYPSAGGSCSPNYFNSTSVNQIKGFINTYGTCISNGYCQ